MSKNMQLSLSLLLDGLPSMTRGLGKVSTQIGNMKGLAQGATAELGRMYQAANGFAATSTMLGGLGAAALARDAENSVLAFQRIQLELKQTAGLANAQVEEISNYAKKSAAAMLTTPTAMIEGAMKLANAGQKYEGLLSALEKSAEAAAAFRATVSDMANMDFDITTKMRVDASQLGDVHNMLLYHARSGRFEAPAMARGAPELFTYASRVGLTGVEGLNLVGAMTQQVMKGIAPDQQTKVLTDFEQGFSHIVSPHYMDGLKNVGIDVEKYMPKGKFYGENGIQGFIDLTKAMKAKGLEDPIALAHAKFADKETKDFWLQMMAGVNGFDAAMRQARTEGKNDTANKNRAEITRSAVGQDAQAKAKFENAQLQNENVVSVWERLKNKAADNIPATAAAAAVLGLGAHAGWKQYQANKTTKLAALENLGKSTIQTVFVSNWPRQLGGASLPTNPTASGLPTAGPEALNKSAKLGEKLMHSAGVASQLAAVGFATFEATSALMETDMGQEFSGWLSDLALKGMAAIGNEDAKRWEKANDAPIATTVTQAQRDLATRAIGQNLTYSPTITIQGNATPEAQASFAEQLKAHQGSIQQMMLGMARNKERVAF